jgi:hypothetical protein
VHEHPDPAAYKGPEEGAPIGLDALAALPGPRLLKTHAQVRHLLGGRAAADSQQAPGLVLPPGPRYVIVSRNPFDACTSYYYHGERRAATRTSACGTIAVPNVVVSDRDRALSAALTVLSAAPLLALSLARSLTHSPPSCTGPCPLPAWNACKSGWPFAAFAEYWLRGDETLHYASWFEWHGEWWKQHQLAQAHAQAQAQQAQTLWVQYESMIADPEAEIARVACFLGVPAEGAAGRALLQRVASGSRFDAMKAQAESASTAGARANTSDHLRKGTKGDWRSHFGRPGCEHLETIFRERYAQSALADQPLME